MWRHLGIRDPFTELPYRQLLRLLYHDILDGIESPKAKAEWIERVNAPLAGDADNEVLEMLVETGQAVDLDDARAFFHHQDQISKITDPMERVRRNAAFAQERAARRAAHLARTESRTSASGSVTGSTEPLAHGQP